MKQGSNVEINYLEFGAQCSGTLDEAYVANPSTAVAD